MQPQTSEAPSDSFRTFAGMLAELTAPKKSPTAPDLDSLHPDGLDLDGLDPDVLDSDGPEDDISFLSYEQALRKGTRIQSARSLKEPVLDSDAFSDKQRLHPPPAAARMGPAPGAFPAKTLCITPPGRRCSSVTIRLSALESEQLHLRAAEAGLTVSAYLRSCAFEVEALRAEVKSTLTQLRSQGVAAETNTEAPQSAPHRRPWSRLWANLAHRNSRR